jgi:hypothetical protein
MGSGMQAVVYGAGYYTEGEKAVVETPEGGAHATRRVGLLYAPLLLDGPERYSAVSQDQFVERARLRRSVSLTGLGIGIQFGSPPA